MKELIERLRELEKAAMHAVARYNYHRSACAQADCYVCKMKEKGMWDAYQSLGMAVVRDKVLAEISGLESDLREADAALQCEYPWRHCKLSTEQTRQRKCVSCLTKIAIRERRPQLFMEES